MSSEPRPRPLTLDGFPHHVALTTRWHDNDIYGHVNNVVYYAFFDTAVNLYLIERCGLDPQGGAVIGLVVETQCRYFRPLSFPDRVTAGLRVAHIGNSSVRYEVALFANDETIAAAQGHFVHVYVDRLTRKPTPLRDIMRAGLRPLLAG